MTQAVQTAQFGNTNPAWRNRIINGAMVIDQRNAGASVSATTALYCLDRWVLGYSQTGKYAVQQNAGSVTPPIGFSNYLGVASSSAYSVVASDYFFIGQRIEANNVSDLAWGTANAKTVTLSFWVYSSLTGTFGGNIGNGDATYYSYPFSYSIPVANTWTYISITVPGPTSGIWHSGTGVGIELRLGLGVGSTYSSTANSWQAGNYISTTGATSVVGTNGATFYITGVQLEVGTAATNFEFRDYGRELALCQRYYEVVYNDTSGVCLVSAFLSGTAQWYQYNFKQNKRANPTFGVQSGSAWQVVTPNLTYSLDHMGFNSASNYFYIAGSAGSVGAYFSAEL